MLSFQLEKNVQISTTDSFVSALLTFMSSEALFISGEAALLITLEVNGDYSCTSGCLKILNCIMFLILSNYIITK